MREEKMIKMYTEIEDKRRETERDHEMNVTQMMFNLMEKLAQPSYPQNSLFNQSYFFHSSLLYPVTLFS